MSRLRDKTALITGAGQGIGRASAELFAREGARVIATDINATALKSLAHSTGCEIHELDVRDIQGIKQLSETVGPVDVLFNCAGFVHSGSVLECREEDWDFSLELNVTEIGRASCRERV